MEQRPEQEAPSLARVRRGALCAGCGGCALVAPGRVRMAVSERGFLRPQQSGTITEDENATIAAICPGLGQTVDAGHRSDHVLWGPYLEMVQGWATNPALRHRSASGGALSAGLTHLLETGQVDSIVQTGADPGLAIANVGVLSKSAADISAAAGSRYAPSAPLADLGPLLAGTLRHAFVGKPCDVAALRALSAIDPRVNARFPVMVSFFCAGVPSLAGGHAVLSALGTSAGALTAFRYRGMGWPGRATATLKDGTERSMSYHESWGGILSKHVQHRCRICADGTGAAADIVCADAWHSDERGYPLFEDDDGVSLIVARTEIGRAVIAAACAAGHLQTGPFDVTQLAAMQPGQSGRRRALLARLAGLWLSRQPIPKYRGLHLRAAAGQNGVAGNLRNFLGMIRRVIQGRVG